MVSNISLLCLVGGGVHILLDGRSPTTETTLVGLTPSRPTDRLSPMTRNIANRNIRNVVELLRYATRSSITNHRLGVLSSSNQSYLQQAQW